MERFFQKKETARFRTASCLGLCLHVIMHTSGGPDRKYRSDATRICYRSVAYFCKCSEKMQSSKLSLQVFFIFI